MNGVQDLLFIQKFSPNKFPTQNANESSKSGQRLE